MIKRVLLALAALALCLSGARADFAFTIGTGATAFSFTAATGGTSLCAASVTHCFASVPINTAGAPIFTAAAPGSVTGSGAAGTAATGVVTVQGIASMTKLLVTPDSVALPANQSVNVSQINGVTPLMGNGVTGTGSPRVTISSDNTAFAVNATLSAETTKVIGTVRNVGNIGGVIDAIGQNIASPANWLQTGCQFNTMPTTITNGNGSPVQCDNGGRILATLASAGPVAPGTAATISNLSGGVYTSAGITLTNGQQAAEQLNSAGARIVATAAADPCQDIVKSFTPFSAITTATTTRIVAPTASKKTYICQIIMAPAAADNVAVVEGTGGTCGTGTAGVMTGTTAANGFNFPANGGVSIGNGGFTVGQTVGTNVDLCLITSAATPLVGGIMWVQK